MKVPTRVRIIPEKECEERGLRGKMRWYEWIGVADGSERAVLSQNKPLQGTNDYFNDSYTDFRPKSRKKRQNH